MLPEVKNQKGEFWARAHELFLKRIAPYELVDSERVFSRLADLADFSNPQIAADADVWCEAVYSQLKQHLHDTPPIFAWVPGKVPLAVSRHTAQTALPRTSGSVTDALDLDAIGKEDAEQKKREQENERLVNACEHAISSFFPVKGRHLAYAVQEPVQKTLRKYLEEQKIRGANMAQVLQKIEAYIENEYKKLAPSERLSERM